MVTRVRCVARAGSARVVLPPAPPRNAARRDNVTGHTLAFGVFGLECGDSRLDRQEEELQTVDAIVSELNEVMTRLRRLEANVQRLAR